MRESDREEEKEEEEGKKKEETEGGRKEVKKLVVVKHNRRNQSQFNDVLRGKRKKKMRETIAAQLLKNLFIFN